MYSYASFDYSQIYLYVILMYSYVTRMLSVNGQHSKRLRRLTRLRTTTKLGYILQTIT